MKKQEFLDALGAGLSGSSDAEEVLDFYREMIEDRMEDGMEEAAGGRRGHSCPLCPGADGSKSGV